MVPVGGGSSMDAAKVISLHAANGGDVLALGYHRDDVAPGRPLVAVPTTAGTGAETNAYGVITDEAAGRKDYVGHPSVLPAWTVLDPALTVGLPPAATAATGIDAMTHAIESLLSANGNPFAEALALRVIRMVGTWLPRAVADGGDLEARSQLLMASHLAGIGQASGTGVGARACARPRHRHAGPPGARHRPGLRAAGGARLLRRAAGPARPRAGAHGRLAARGLAERGRRPRCRGGHRRIARVPRGRSASAPACAPWASTRRHSMCSPPTLSRTPPSVTHRASPPSSRRRRSWPPSSTERRSRHAPGSRGPQPRRSRALR